MFIEYNIFLPIKIEILKYKRKKLKKFAKFYKFSKKIVYNIAEAKTKTKKEKRR